MPAQHFTPKLFTFLRELAENNDRDWFQPRKEIFETKLKAPMLELIESINAELMDFAPEHVTDPKKALYRIYRDTRFGDKTPFKTNVGIQFRHEMGRDIHALCYERAAAVSGEKGLVGRVPPAGDRARHRSGREKEWKQRAEEQRKPELSVAD